MVFLGPTFREVMTNETDKNWIVRSCPVELQENGSGRISPAKPSSVLLDLQSEVDEEIFSLDNVITRVTGTDKWSELVRRTFDRHRNETTTH